MSWRDDFDPDNALSNWEPIPWDLADETKIEAQWQGWKARCDWLLEWRAPTPNDFVKLRLSPEQINDAEIEFVSCLEHEALLLIDRFCHGFPDPPRYGLISKSMKDPTSPWVICGSFKDLPKHWKKPGSIGKTNSHRG